MFGTSASSNQTVQTPASGGPQPLSHPNVAIPQQALIAMSLAALIPCCNDDYSLSMCVPLISPYVDDVCIVDDCSRDATPLVCQELCATFANVSVHRAKRPLGWAGARNQLLQLSNADRVLFIDADDLFAPNAVDGLKSIANSRAPVVELGLAELWGDFCHGTGRGLEKPHFDPCHCYVNRLLVPYVHWELRNSHATLVTGTSVRQSDEVICWHAKGVKTDRRLVARRLMNRWMAAGCPQTIDQWVDSRFTCDDIHDAAIDRLLHDEIDPICRLTAGPCELPRPEGHDRFEMVYQGKQVVDRIDHGWNKPTP